MQERVAKHGHVSDLIRVQKQELGDTGINHPRGRVHLFRLGLLFSRSHGELQRSSSTRMGSPLVGALQERILNLKIVVASSRRVFSFNHVSEQCQ
jgi:hypothetical protein